MAEVNPVFDFGPTREIRAADIKPVSEGGQADGFGDMFNSFLKDVNGMQLKADESIQKMVAGEIKDVHQVMLAAGEAKVAFNLLLEIRNKTMEAYKEILSMRA